MSQQTPAEQGHEKLGANRFSVATQGILVVTRTRLLNTNHVATLSKYVTTQSKSKPREQVAIEYKNLRQRQRERLKALSRQTFSCLEKRPTWARILGIYNAINEVRPNIGKPINTRF